MNVVIRHSPHGGGWQEPTRIIIHAMGEYIKHAGKVLHAVDFLEAVGLSAHAFVAPNGDVIRGREDNAIAWHAKGHNTNTLGLEALVPGAHDLASLLVAMARPGWCSDAQFAAAVRQCRQWRGRWPIRAVERHSDVDPARKQDPGAGFPWSRFIDRVYYKHGTL